MGNKESDLRDAAREGNVEETTRLLGLGTEIDCTDGYGNTPLIVAAMYGQENIAQLLILNGAKINKQNETGFTALFIAARYGYFNVVDILLINKNCKIDLPDKFGWTPLFAASQTGKVKVVEMLMRRGAKIDSKNSDGKDALDTARENNQTDIVRTIELLMKEYRRESDHPVTVYAFEKQALLLDESQDVGILQNQDKV